MVAGGMASSEAPLIYDAVWWAQIEALKEELAACDDKTKAFVGPLLKYEAVKQLLLSFVRDKTKTLAEWVWDPNSQRVLGKLKERLPDVDMPQADDIFLEALSLQCEAGKLAVERSEKEAEKLLKEALSIKADAKEKFDQGNYYGAMNAYLRAAEVLDGKKLPEGAGGNDTNNQGDEVNFRAAGKRIVLDCRCNAAVCAWKNGEMEDVKRAATKALVVDASCVKALFWRGRANEKLQLYDNALMDLKRAMEVASGGEGGGAGGSSSSSMLEEVKVWHERVQAMVTKMEETRRRLNELKLMRDEEKRSRGEIPFSDDEDESDDDDDDWEGEGEGGHYRRRGPPPFRSRHQPHHGQYHSQRRHDPYRYLRQQCHHQQSTKRESGKDMVYMMPRPPDMTDPDLTPTKYVNEYMKAFKHMSTLTHDVYEVPDSRPALYEHTMTLPPYLEVRAQDKSHKRAKMRCSLKLLKEAQNIYRTQREGKDDQGNDIPEEPKGWADAKTRFDDWTAALEAKGRGGGDDRPLQPQEFIDYADAWMDAIVAGKIPAGRFMHNLSTDERRAIHSRVSKHGLKSASVGPADQRQLSIFLKDAKKRAERQGYAEIPGPPFLPTAEVLEDIVIVNTDLVPPKPQQQPPPPPPPPPPKVAEPARRRRRREGGEEGGEKPEDLIFVETFTQGTAAAPPAHNDNAPPPTTTNDNHEASSSEGGAAAAETDHRDTTTTTGKQQQSSSSVWGEEGEEEEERMVVMGVREENGTLGAYPRREHAGMWLEPVTLPTAPPMAPLDCITGGAEGGEEDQQQTAGGQQEPPSSS